MKYLFFFLFICCSGAASAQYFNIFPIVCDSTSSGQFHYHVDGIEEFTDSLVLNVELLTNDSTLTLITSRTYDLSDTVAADFAGFTRDIPANRFYIDLGDYPTDAYLVHIWIWVAGAVYNEMYYHQ